MKLNITKWHPDTCGCEIDYQWDADEPAETRTHTAVNTVTCAFHSGTHTEVHAKVIKENQNKNKAIGIIMDDPDMAEDVLINGETQRRFKLGKDVRWSFDTNRVLELDIIGADATLKDKLLKDVEKVVAKEDVKLK